MINSPHVLLVEDDLLVAKTVSVALGYKGIMVSVCGNCREALHWLEQHKVDLVLLDLNLPDGDGIDLCREIRQLNDCLPILLVTARIDEASAVAGFEHGADDYIRKPFGTQELLARMNRLLAMTASSGVYQRGITRVDMTRHEVTIAGVPLAMGKREFAILAQLMRRPGEVVRRDELLDDIDSDCALYERTIDSHVSHLRKKLKDARANVQIAAVYGIGYKLQ